MEEIIQKFRAIGIIPVVVIDDPDDAEPLSDALCEGGLGCAEVTFRTDAAAETIRRMHERHPEMLVGAGTVLTIEQMDAAKDAGAKFFVSPGFNPEVVKHALSLKIPMLPGTQTPSEMEAAMALGLNAVKFFPAEASGGMKMLKAVAAPYVHLDFMPTGGLNPDNVKEYLAWNRIIACGGSWIAKKDLIAQKNFAEIKGRAEEAHQIVVSIRGEKRV